MDKPTRLVGYHAFPERSYARNLYQIPYEHPWRLGTFLIKNGQQGPGGRRWPGASKAKAKGQPFNISLRQAASRAPFPYEKSYQCFNEKGEPCRTHPFDMTLESDKVTRLGDRQTSACREQVAQTFDISIFDTAPSD